MRAVHTGGAPGLRRIERMRSTLRLATGLLAIGCCGQVLAQATAAATTASGVAPGRTRSHIVIIEDDGARIEEVHVGGRVQRITVQSKIGNARAYEIEVAPAGRDPSQERGNAGRRAWSVLNF